MNMKRTMLFLVALMVFAIPFAFADSQSDPNKYVNITVDIDSAPYYVTGPVLEDGDAAPVDELDLFPGTTVRVWCNGTANDTNGYADLNTAIGVLFHTSSTAAAADDPTNHYSAADCTIAPGTWNVDGAFSCAFDLQFYALPGEWTCELNITDQGTNWNASNDTSVVTDLIAISVPAGTLNFGTLLNSENTGTDDYNVTVTNLGNRQLDVQLDAYSDWSTPDNADADAMTCVVGSIPTTFVRYAIAGAQDYTAKTPLSVVGLVTEAAFDLAPQTAGAVGTTRNVAFGLEAPAAVGGVCVGVLNFVGIIG